MVDKVCVVCGELKKHYAKGMCGLCYSRNSPGRKSITCVVCGEDRPHRGFGMCARCYMAQYKCPIKTPKTCTSCGREMITTGKGLCYTCHRRENGKTITCIECGNIGKTRGRGLCTKCYTKAQYSEHREENIARMTKRSRERGVLAMSENKSCSSYLGVHVAEKVLYNTFDNVEKMPTNNPGYDFICNKGMKIDVKSATMRKNAACSRWEFHINKNDVADFFFCIAFDIRTDINPIHLWLIPGKNINHLTTVTMSESRMEKWTEYELAINKVVDCCNTLRG